MAQVEPAYAHCGSATELQRLDTHLFRVSRRCGLSATKIGMSTCGALIGLLHDLGKNTQTFQEYLLSFSLVSTTSPQDHLRGKIDHSTAGAQCIVREMVGAEEESSLPGLIARMLALCVVSHHSGLIDCVTPDGVDSLNRRLQRADKDTRFVEAWRTLPDSVRVKSARIFKDPELLSEGSRMCSRLFGRRTEGDRALQFGLMVRLLFSCLIDADRTDTADFVKPRAMQHRQGGTYVSWKVLGDRLHAHLGLMPRAGRLNETRSQISDECFRAAERPRGIYTLTVPTGGGKTLAALRFALEHARLSMLQREDATGVPVRGFDRIFFISPYISIVDQNARVARDCLEPAGSPFASIVLEHHSNLVREGDGRDGEDAVGDWRRRVLAENWDAPVVFTTMVQVMDALFSGGTGSVRRLHTMANAVIIFDEVQTLPIKLIHLFNNAINLLATHCGSTIVLCTATQPLLQDVDKAKGAASLASAAELVTDVTGLFQQLHRYSVFDQSRRSGGWTRQQVAELACEEGRLQGSCLVVVNTKKDAQEVFQACRAMLGMAAYIVHLSTAMCAVHRMDVLEGLKQRLIRPDGRPLICISTQLIEAGVDIDFAVVIRDLAGLDSIAQAAGRCNRHGNRSRLGRVHIVALPDLPKGLEEIRKGRQVAAEVLGLWWKDHPDEAFPLDDVGQMRSYYERAFTQRKTEMSYSINAKDNAARSDTLLRMLGENGLAVADARHAGKPVDRGYLRQSFKTSNDAFAMIEETHGIIVPFRDDGKEIVAKLGAAFDLAKEWQLLRYAQPYTVSVYPWQFKRMADTGAIYEVSQGTGVFCLQPEFYDPSTGLRPEAGPLESLIE